MNINFEIGPELAKALREIASKLGVSVDQLAKAAVADMLNKPESEFIASAEYVLKKNEELYRRLAK